MDDQDMLKMTEAWEQRSKKLKQLFPPHGVPEFATVRYSKDQIIGLIRELETGEDPYKNERQAPGSEFADNNFMRAPKKFRDSVDKEMATLLSSMQYAMPPEFRSLVSTAAQGFEAPPLDPEVTKSVSDNLKLFLEGKL